MRRFAVCLAVLLVAFGVGAWAQGPDVSGQWQGTLHTPQKDLRIIVKVTKDDGKLQGTMWRIDQEKQGFRASGVTLSGSTFKYSVEMMGVSYEGKVDSDGKTITGTWTQGTTAMPLVLTKATTETAWEIPEAPAPPKMMPANANPSFDVATIKPNISGGDRMQQLTMHGRNFTVRNGSLADLIGFAYDVQASQITNGPDWMEKDRYDIDAIPDQEGMPSLPQARRMLKKLLASRFNLKVSDGKREMTAFVMMPAKDGLKLKPTDSKVGEPGYGVRPASNGMTLLARDTSMKELTGFLGMVLDRPVVDETGATGRYDIAVTFTPDESEFGGHPPKLPALAEGVEPAPDLFTAMQQQIGVKLSSEKAPVDVVVVDHVEKPSPN